MRDDDRRTRARVSRRALLAGSATLAAGAGLARAQGAPADTSKMHGAPLEPLSPRSPFARVKRTMKDGQFEGITYTPIEDLDGIITPNDLHFSRHHAGVPQIDPKSWSLTLHGLVERPLVLSFDELTRLPSVSRVAFVECSGNGVAAARGSRKDMTASEIDGAMSCSVWTGTLLKTLLHETGVKPTASWFIAQSQDGAQYARSIPIDKAWDDAMVAWAQNGEPLRTEQGYPARLLLPGYEGSAQVKWLRRIELVDKPVFFREETARYSDVRQDGRIEAYRLVHDVKSCITFPTFPRVVTPGWWEVRGLAWSGRGRIAKVEVSTDGGATWALATLDDPVLPRAHTRFRLPWEFRGAPALLWSRATDETGAVQPTHAALAAARTPGHDYHNNAIRGWRVSADGSITFERSG